MKIFFLHIPKTAGQSVHAALVEAFGEDAICPARVNTGSTELLEDFRGYQERWGTHDLAIVAVNVDDGLPGMIGSEEIRDFTRQQNIIFPVLLGPGQLTTAAYGVTQVPTAVVIDAAGRVSA